MSSATVYNIGTSLMVSSFQGRNNLKIRTTSYLHHRACYILLRDRSINNTCLLSNIILCVYACLYTHIYIYMNEWLLLRCDMKNTSCSQARSKQWIVAGYFGWPLRGGHYIERGEQLLWNMFVCGNHRFRPSSLFSLSLYATLNTAGYSERLPCDIFFTCNYNIRAVSSYGQ